MASLDQIRITQPLAGESTMNAFTAKGTVLLGDPYDDTPPTVSAKIYYPDNPGIGPDLPTSAANVAITTPQTELFEWKFDFGAPQPYSAVLVVKTKSENSNQIPQELKAAAGNLPQISAPTTGTNVQSPFSVYGTVSGCANLTATLSVAGGPTYQGTLVTGCPTFQFNFSGIGSNLTNPTLTVCCDGTCTQITLGTVYGSGGGGHS